MVSMWGNIRFNRPGFVLAVVILVAGAPITVAQPVSESMVNQADVATPSGSNPIVGSGSSPTHDPTGGLLSVDDTTTGASIGTASQKIASVEVLSIDGNGPTTDGAFRHQGFSSIRIRVENATGAPIERSSLSINISYTNQFGFTEVYPVRLEGQGGGEYTATNLPVGVVSTQYVTLSVDSSAVTTDVPVLNAFGDAPLLESPIQGWAFAKINGYENVTVGGETYYVLRLFENEAAGTVPLRTVEDSGSGGSYAFYREAQPARESPSAWVVFDSRGRPVADQQTRKQAALAAHVSTLVDRRGRDRLISYLGDTYPEGLRNVRDLGELARWLISIRDTAAEGIGEIAGAAVSGGFSALLKEGAEEGAEKVFKEGAEEAAERATAKVKREFLKNLIDNYLPPVEDLRSQPLSATKEGFRALANAQLTDSAHQAETASQTISTHQAGDLWSYQEADQFWRNYNESLIDGIFYMELRTELLPEGDAKTQLKDAVISVTEGATGIPVGEFYDLLTSDRLGYLSDAINATEYLRARQRAAAREYGAWSAAAQQAVRSAQQGTSDALFKRAPASGAGTVDGSIVSFTAARGTVVVGDRVASEVTVENTGEQPHTFFVGYSAQDPTGEYHDNFGTTGTQVDLAPGERTTVTVDWTVEGDLPTGSYDLVTAIWKEADREQLSTRLDSITRQDTITVKPSLAGYWSFEATGSDSVVRDRSGTGHDGTIVGDPRRVPGVQGSALRFDGENDYVRVDMTPALQTTTSFTLSLWVKTEANASSGAALGMYTYDGSGQGEETYITVKPDSVSFHARHSSGFGRPGGGAANDPYYHIPGSPPSITPGEWTHVALVYDDSKETIALYLDGEREFQLDAPKPPRVDDTYLAIGAQPDRRGPADSHFQGTIDEVQVHHRALSDIPPNVTTLEPVSICSECQPPGDPDNDDRYEDVNGDDTFDIIDVSVFLDTFDSVDSGNVASYDFNGDGQINILDVSTLLGEL